MGSGGNGGNVLGCWGKGLVRLDCPGDRECGAAQDVVIAAGIKDGSDGAGSANLAKTCALLANTGVLRDRRLQNFLLLQGVSAKRPSPWPAVRVDAETAVSRPPLLVGARWENDEAGVRQPIEKKGGTKLNTNVEVARSVVGL